MRPPEFWSRNDPASRAIAAMLSPLGFFQAASVIWKYRRQNSYRSPAKVICVGNLTVGGSGKTPVAIALAQMIQATGAAVVFLTRGYGRRSSQAICVDVATHDAATVGDEALLLARIAPTIVARNRAEGARLAERQGAEIIVMDDGYQNFTLAKDLALVVVDGQNPFGNGRVIPAGPLRESIRHGLGRADAVIVMGGGTSPSSDFSGPILRAHLVSDLHFKGRQLIAFAGIGRPDKFFATLRAQGAQLVETRSFADHHVYSSADIAMLKDRADRAGAGLISTEKDLVRLNAKDREGITALQVHAVFEDHAAAARLLAPLLAGSVPNS
jgi:tetraacyldisaccharide 4'-kinase